MCFFNIFVIINHPMFLRLLLVLITVIIITNIYDSNLIIWFSYILCLIYLGGVLILFIYISSFLPNSKFLSIPFISIFFFWSILRFIFFQRMKMNEFHSLRFNNLIKFNIIFERNKIFFIYFSIFYLISILLISVYYSSFNKIPLRRIR